MSPPTQYKAMPWDPMGMGGSSRWSDILWDQKLYLHKKSASSKMFSFHKRLFLSPGFVSTLFLIYKVGLTAVPSLISLLWEFRQNKSKLHTHIHSWFIAQKSFLFHPDESILTRKVTIFNFPGGSVVKESTCECRRCRRHRFNLCVGKIAWRRKWQLTPVFLPGKSHGQRNLVGCVQAQKESDTTEHMSINSLQEFLES